VGDFYFLFWLLQAYYLLLWQQGDDEISKATQNSLKFELVVIMTL